MPVLNYRYVWSLSMNYVHSVGAEPASNYSYVKLGLKIL